MATEFVLLCLSRKSVTWRGWHVLEGCFTEERECGGQRVRGRDRDTTGRGFQSVKINRRKLSCKLINISIDVVIFGCTVNG